MKKAFILFSIPAFLMLWTCVRNHKMNWDGIGYAAVTISSTENDPQKIHQTTYEMLRRYVPEKHYRTLVESEFRALSRSDDRVLIELLPYYKVKVLYVLLLRFFGLLGVEPFQAMTWISLFFSAGICWLILFWIAVEWKHWISGVVSFLVCYLSGVFEVSRYWTPDAFATFVTLLAIFMLVERRNAFWGVLFSIISIWIRVDIVFLLALVIAFVVFMAPQQYRILSRWSFLAILVAFAISVFITQFISGYYGWRQIFHHTFVELIADQQSYVPKDTITDYIGIVRTNLSRAFRNSDPLFVFLILSFIGYFLPVHQSLRAVLYQRLLVVTASALIIKFLIFPTTEIRFYVSFYCMIGIALAMILPYQSLRTEKDSNSAEIELGTNE